MTGNVVLDKLQARDVDTSNYSDEKALPAADLPPIPDLPSALVKRQRCLYHKMGTCKWGQACYFAHGEDDAADTDAASTVVREKRAWNGRKKKKTSNLCSFFQAGCCTSGADCIFKHQYVPEDRGRKTSLCPLFFGNGSCPSDSCFNAHSSIELRIPLEFADKVGYKRALCTYHLFSDLSCSDESYRCFDAHGELDLRRQTQIRLTQPESEITAGMLLACTDDDSSIWASITEYEEIGRLAAGATVTAAGAPQKSDGYMMVPILPQGAIEMRYVIPVEEARAETALSFEFADAHIHLDQVMLARRWGSGWMYKSLICRDLDGCPYGKESCVWAHGAADLRPRPPYGIDDFTALMRDITSIPGGSLAGCVTSCCGVDAIEETLKLVAWGREKADGRIYATFGIHPSTFEQYTEEIEKRLEAALEQCGEQAVAWGECGLDYNKRAYDFEKDPRTKERMKEVFARQAHIAVRRGLPLVVHSRDAVADTFAVLREAVPSTHPIHLHSFMGAPEEMLYFLDQWPNSVVGIAGAVTWPIATKFKGGLGDMARAVPLNKLLLETDGPYMAPLPHRGEESHPGHIPLIAAEIARYKGDVSMHDVLKVTTQNFRRFFGIDGFSNQG